MSFFIDFLQSLNIDSIDDKMVISIVVGEGISVIGKFKIITLEETMIELESQKRRIIFEGQNLIVKTVSKGEVIVCGDILKITTGECYEK